MPLKFRWIWVVAGLVAACAPVISPQVQRQAAAVDFAHLQSQPDEYRGQTVILGGLVMSVKPYKNGSLLWVDQRPLDHQNQPLRNAASSGSFAVASEKWLASYEYMPKRAVTVAGVVDGRANGVVLLQAREITPGEYEPWEEYYYPIPRHWYDYDPRLEYWYTPPYFDPRRPGRQ